jgi:hypothetical protein
MSTQKRTGSWNRSGIPLSFTFEVGPFFINMFLYERSNRHCNAQMPKCQFMITSSPFITKYFEFIFKKKFNLIKIRPPHLPPLPLLVTRKNGTLFTIVHIWHTYHSLFFLCKCLLTFYTQCHLFLWTISLLILNFCIFMAFNQDIHDLWPIFFQYYKWSFIIHYSYTLQKVQFN